MPRRRQRAFTLIELLVGVAIVGVLAALASVGYRRYVASAESKEAVHICQSIRYAEEAYRSERLSYFNVSEVDEYYPRKSAALDRQTMHWDNQTGANYLKWQQLAVAQTGPVKFGYKVNAGAAGVAVNVPTETKTAPTWPSPTLEVWYVVQAKGDPDGDGAFTLFLGSSFTGELYKEGS